MAVKRLSYVFNNAILNKGDTFEIGVPSMAGHGYEWEIVDCPMGITQTGALDIPEYGDSRAKHFQLRADKPGSYKFNVRLHNPNATKKQKQTRAEYTFKIQVK